MSKSSEPKGLFELIDLQEDKEKPKEECTHKIRAKTETVWPGETCHRLTWTCQACGFIIGRMP